MVKVTAPAMPHTWVEQPHGHQKTFLVHEMTELAEPHLEVMRALLVREVAEYARDEAIVSHTFQHRLSAQLLTMLHNTAKIVDNKSLL